MSTELTHERLKEVLHYCPDTGHWTWLVKAGSRMPGARAGTKNISHGYVLRIIEGRKFAEHRLAWFYMTGKWPTAQIDHKDGVRSNNRWSNLREANDAENRQNMAKKKGTVSRLQGVTWFGRDQCWMARIGLNYKSIFLGYHDTQEGAHKAYLEAKACHHKFQPTTQGSANASA